MNAIRFFAHAVSLIFNPLLLLFTLPYVVIYHMTNDSLYSLKWVIFTAVFLFVIFLLIIFGRIRGIFSDLDVTKREERPKLYAMTFVVSLLYLFSILFLKGIMFPLSILTFGGCVAVVAFGIVNNRIKASGHVAVSLAFVLTIGLLYGFNYFLSTAWIVPLVVWSRLYLKRHTPQEVVTGAILGMIITIGTFLLGKYLYGI